jgi:hypothetical protein
MKACNGGARKRRIPARAWLPAALALGLAEPAAATVFTYELDAGLRHEDNVTLSENDPESDTILFGSFRFVVKHETPRLEIRGRGNLRYFNYLGDTFPDELRGELSAQLDWTIVPNRVHWVVEDYASRQEVDVLGRPDPSNQQQVNVFLTGPTFLFRFGRANIGQLDLRYMDSFAEQTDSFNGQRVIGRASILRELNPRTTAGLHLEATHARLRESASDDYKRWDAYVSFERRVPALHLKADLGYSRIEPEQALTSVSSPLFRGRMDWNPRGRHHFNATLDYQLADAAQRLIQRSSDFANETYTSVVTSGELLDQYDALGSGDIAVGSDAYRERRVDLGYRYEGDRATVRVHPYVQRTRYLDELSAGASDLDRNSRGEAVELEYKLRPRLNLAVRAFDQRLDYRNIDRNDTVRGVSVALLDRSARNWRWRIEATHVRRDSNVPDQSYRDNTIGFAIIRQR